MRLAQGEGGHMTERGFGEGNWCAAGKVPKHSPACWGQVNTSGVPCMEQQEPGNHLGSGSGCPRAGPAKPALQELPQAGSGTMPLAPWLPVRCCCCCSWRCCCITCSKWCPQAQGGTRDTLSRGFLQLALQVVHGLYSCVSRGHLSWMDYSPVSSRDCFA